MRINAARHLTASTYSPRLTFRPCDERPARCTYITSSCSGQLLRIRVHIHNVGNSVRTETKSPLDLYLRTYAAAATHNGIINYCARTAAATVHACRFELYRSPIRNRYDFRLFIRYIIEYSNPLYVYLRTKRIV